MNASTLFFASEFGIHNICICLVLVYCATPDGRLTTKLESSFSDFLALHHSLVDGIGIDAQRRLPILGPNPFCRKTFPDMEMDEIRKEITLKRLSDMLHIIMKHDSLRNR